MKRMIMAAMAAVALLALSGCDMFGGTSGSGSSTPVVSYSQWWVKGSFDGWTGPGDTAATDATTHFLAIDSLNSNTLTYTITGKSSADLHKFGYAFTLMSPDPAAGPASRTKFSYVFPTGTTDFADNTWYTLVPSTTTGAGNCSFVASATSYTLTVDITTPTAPKVKLVPGSTASASYSFAELTSNMKMGSGVFNGWTETLGTVDATAKTVSWTAQSASTSTDQKAAFYFHGDVGYLNADGAEYAAATTANGQTVLPVAGNGNFVLKNLPNRNSVYTILLSVDPTQTSMSSIFTVKAITTTVGSGGWVYAPWSAVYLVGTNAEFGAWTPTSAIATTGSSNVFTTTITASVSGQEQFQLIPTNVDWSGQVGFAGIASSSSSNLSSNGGNIAFTATSGTTYTITVDMSQTAFSSDGKPVVTVTP
jgi:hypothetical protein